MKLTELIGRLKLTVLTPPEEDCEVTGCYIGDLLSWVMGKASAGDVWITIMSNINIVAVASLTGAACILLCEGVSAEESVLNKARAEGIAVLQSELSAYELACLIGREI